MVDQEKAVEEIGEIEIDKKRDEREKCEPQLHTQYRQVLGQLNWVQSRTQWHICYLFSRAASAAASPTVADVKNLNRVVKQLRAQPAKLYFWPLKTHVRIMGIPDASYQNNSDKSSQRGTHYLDCRGEGSAQGHYERKPGGL